MTCFRVRISWRRSGDVGEQIQTGDIVVQTQLSVVVADGKAEKTSDPVLFQHPEFKLVSQMRFRLQGKVDMFDVIQYSRHPLRLLSCSCFFR